MKLNKVLAPLALSALLAMSLSACQKNEDPAASAPAVEESANNDASAEKKEEAKEEEKAEDNTLSVDEYKAEVQNLNTVTGDLMNDLLEWTKQVQANPTDTEGAVAGIQEMKKVTEAYDKFVAINNPPAVYADVHTKLSTSVDGFSKSLTTYFDHLAGSLTDESITQETLQADNDAITKYVTDISTAMQEFEAIEVK